MTHRNSGSARDWELVGVDALKCYSKLWSEGNWPEVGCKKMQEKRKFSHRSHIDPISITAVNYMKNAKLLNGFSAFWVKSFFLHPTSGLKRSLQLKM